MGVLLAAHKLGLKVPDDVAVMGFDDIEAAEPLLLTTVRQPLHETGARGVELLLDALVGCPPGSGPMLLPLSVVERATTAAR